MLLTNLNSEFRNEDIFNHNVGNNGVNDVVGFNITRFGAANAAYIQQSTSLSNAKYYQIEMFINTLGRLTTTVM
jgi:hypothetical protein